MSMQDPIADMFTRVRNAQRVGKTLVEMPASKLKIAIAGLLEAEGYIESHGVSEGNLPVLSIRLKYHQGSPVIELIKRISRPGLRVYKACADLPKVFGGLGVVIVSTSQGVMTGGAAAKAGFGGEIIGCVA